MEETPTVHHYQVEAREEVFGFFREVYPADVSARVITQWRWRYESSPCTREGGPAVNILRLDGKMVGLTAGFRLKMWMGGYECFGEGRGSWVVHPDYRGRNLTKRINARTTYAPVQFGWTHLPSGVPARVGFHLDPISPLIRILDAGPLIEHFTHSHYLAILGRLAHAPLRLALRPLESASRSSGGAVTRLDRFDNRADELWTSARRAQNVMVIRDYQYLNWRYFERPDATYLVYGFERASRLEGFLIARLGTYHGMPWGYLVDFLAPDGSGDVLRALIGEALAELRRLKVAAVSCLATDPAVRNALFRSGFLPAPQRHPVKFARFIRTSRTDLAHFIALKRWYLTMGDGDLELAP
jgi:hypothetical protein